MARNGLYLEWVERILRAHAAKRLYFSSSDIDSSIGRGDDSLLQNEVPALDAQYKSTDKPPTPLSELRLAVKC